MRHLLKVMIITFSFLYSSVGFSLENVTFPYDTIGRVGHCSAALLSQRVAFLSAHCLLQLNKDLKPDAHQFIINGQAIDIEVAVIGSSEFALDTMYNPLVTKDWAFVILKESKSIRDGMYLRLSHKKDPSSVINSKNNLLKPTLAYSVGLDENLNMVRETCNVYNEKNSDLLLTTCKQQVGGYSGILFDQSLNVFALMGISAGYYVKDTKIPKSVKNIAIPVTNVMVQIFEAMDYLTRYKPTISPKRVLYLLSDLYYTDKAMSDIVVMAVTLDPKTELKVAILQPLKSYRLINKMNVTRIPRGIVNRPDLEDDSGYSENLEENLRFNRFRPLRDRLKK